MNTFGRMFRLTTWGESHGKAIGGVIDGCVAGVEIDWEAVRYQMNRRKPGQSAVSTERTESDTFEVLSGMKDGKTTGQPISFIIYNQNQKSADYHSLENIYRPSHADYTYAEKYGIRDAAGGGRSSARETANWVFAGSIARQILSQKGIDIYAFVKQIGTVKFDKNYDQINRSEIEKYITRCPDKLYAAQMEQYILQMKEAGDTCGGAIQAVIEGLPVGLGEPIFDKLHARLAAAMMGINACRAFELGEGIDMSEKKGSEMNDAFAVEQGKVVTTTNHSAGIQGGISNGMPVWMNIYFKPVSSIKQTQQTIDTSLQETSLQITGRHDPCVVPRAVPIIESLAALVVLDFLLLQEKQ